MKIGSYFFIFFLFVFCGCGKQNIVGNYPQDTDLRRKEFAGNMFGNKEGVLLYGNDNHKNENKNIWKKSIAVISDILPILIADENSGLISTDWGKITQISGNDELYKINVVIGDNVTVSVFNMNGVSTQQDNQRIKDEILRAIRN